MPTAGAPASALRPCPAHERLFKASSHNSCTSCEGKRGGWAGLRARLQPAWLRTGTLIAGVSVGALNTSPLLEKSKGVSLNAVRSPELLEWCRHGGVCWNGIEAGYVAEGWRGVLATKELSPGTCVLRVPRRLLMSVESARQDRAMAAALQTCGGEGCLSSEQVLAAHLLLEAAKGPSSFWHTYLLSLPRTYTTAMCFTQEEAQELQVAAAVAAVQAAAAAAGAQHAAALPLLRALRLEPAKWRSRAAWLWAASTLSSRTMYLPGDPAGALMPFGDLHNYRPPPPPYTPLPEELVGAARSMAAVAADKARVAAGAAPAPAPAASGAARSAAASVANAAVSGCSGSGPAAAGEMAAAGAAESAGAAEAAAAAAAAAAGAAAEVAEEEALAGDGHLDEAAGEYCIFVRTRYAAGEQVFLCYGQHTNLELLQHYGFVLADNLHDTAALPAHLLPPAVQRQLSGDYGGGSSTEGSGPSDSHACESVELPQAYLHANGAPSWELLRALRLGCASSAERKAGACRALADQPISAASERAAFEALLRAAQAALAALPTSLEEDEQRLQQLRQQAAGPPPQPLGEPNQQQEGQGAARGEQRRQEQEEQQQGQQGQQGRPLEQANDGSSSGGGSPGRRRWGTEKLCVAVEWRLCHKRILSRGIRLCQAVLAALPPAAQQNSSSAQPPADIASCLAALQRKPRW